MNLQSGLNIAREKCLAVVLDALRMVQMGLTSKDRQREIIRVMAEHEKRRAHVAHRPMALVVRTATGRMALCNGENALDTILVNVLSVRIDQRKTGNNTESSNFLYIQTNGFWMEYVNGTTKA